MTTFRVPFLGVVALVVLLSACGSGGEGGGCPDGCADHQSCVDNACACDDGFLDCDGRADNGCEAAGTDCDCQEAAASIFCAANGAECGTLTAPGRCGGERTVECGACPVDEECGSETPNVCGPPGCQGESESELCRDAGKECGTYTATDSCGERRTVSCGACPSAEECRANECVTRILGDREPCIRNGTSLGECGEGLTCAGDNTTAVCMTVCRSDEDCPEGMGCAPGIFADGSGSCGRFRAENESCHWIEDGVDFCYDPDAEAEGTYLGCFSSTCRYVCAVEGYEGQLSCPQGRICEAEWHYSADVGVDVRLCEAVPEVGERGVCVEGGVEVAPCAEGLRCVNLGGGDGQCLRTCTEDGGCPEGESCALDFLEGGAGVCGALKGPGETGCDDVRAGPNFCWDFGAVPGGWLLCLGSTCQYLCGISEDPTLEASCPYGFACTGGYETFPELPGLHASVCQDDRLEEKAVCFDGGAAVGECKPELACVGTETRKVCQTVCATDDECPEGRSCLAGALADGRGTCVTYRADGETCSADLETGHEVCLDPAPLGGSSLECLSSRCQYVCHEQGSADPPGECPQGFECPNRYRTYPGHPVALAVCQPACAPQSDAVLCTGAGYTCGTATLNDCGTPRTVNCGGCSSGSACNGNRCLAGNIPENGQCLDGSGNAVSCASGLTCVGWTATVGTCKKQCYLDYECPAPQRCAEGVLSNGHGICGSFLAPGQYCDPMSTSSEFCWTTDDWDRVECLSGRCRYVCEEDTLYDTWACPMGMSCSSTLSTYPGYPNRLATCQ